MNKRKVVNLSKKVLNECELNLLQKGLNFIPMPTNVAKNQYMKDIDYFRRSLLLKVFFKDDGSKKYVSTTLEKIARKENKSPFQPPGIASIDAYAEALKDEISNVKLKKITDNLDMNEREALLNLSKDTKIVIK